jgi:hypothetical protein
MIPGHQSSDVADHLFEPPREAAAVGIAGEREASTGEVGEEGAQGGALGLARRWHEPDGHAT